jgi:hypothetical protein
LRCAGKSSSEPSRGARASSSSVYRDGLPELLGQTLIEGMACDAGDLPNVASPRSSLTA